MSYKRLGDLINFVSMKNMDGKATILYGINIDKFFMPSVANTIGVDLTKYKVVDKFQFACNRMHVGRDERLPISMSTYDYKFIVSPAYDVFEIKVDNVLPEYLMMWFRRKEFDRQCWFYTDADVRQGLSREALEDIEIEIPPIEKQRAIVAQYQAVADKIKVNEQICQKLEATAQALYKRWFVDFEFPNEEGKPYKSSGGTMLYNEELEKEVPEGWEVSKVEYEFKIVGGGTPKTEVIEYWEEGNILWYSPTDLTRSNSIYSYATEKQITKEGLKNSSAKLLPKDSVLMTSRATIGKICFNELESSTNQGFINILPNQLYSKYYIYCWIKDNLSVIHSLSTGSTFLEISKGNFNSISFLKSNDLNLYSDFDRHIKPIFENIKNIEFQTKKFTEVQSLLLSRLARD